MQPLLAIVWLTLKAAFRYRLVFLLAMTLLAGVIILPLVIKDDGTAQGFTQIILTYTLSMITALLGFANLWLACGTLARDMEEAQMQMVAVKPIPRWQIWLGKWLGILAMNAGLLLIAGVAIYVLMQYRASKLPVEQQQILRSQVLIARGSAKEAKPDIEADVERILREALKDRPPNDQTDIATVRRLVEERVLAQHQVVPPGYMRKWDIPFGMARNSANKEELTLRVKFNVADASEGKTYGTIWEIGVPASGRLYRTELKLPADSYYEFKIPANLLAEDGTLPVLLINPNEEALLVPLDDGLEALYTEGGFALNFMRGLTIIFCWLAVLAAVGLTASTFLAFPVAAFCSIAVLVLAMSSGTLDQIVEEGGVMGVNHETGFTDNPTMVDRAAVPVAKVMLSVLNLARDFSPIDKLSSGRSISWGELLSAFLKMIVLTCGVLGATGMVIFSRRELATAQTGH